MTLPTCSRRWAWLFALLTVPSAAVAHKLHVHHEPEPVSAPVALSQPAPETFTTGDEVDGLLRQYSLTGDDKLLEQARERLAVESASQTPQALLQAAWLAQADHAFDESRALVAQLVTRQPRNGQAWLLDAAVANVMNDQPAARHACSKVAVTVSPTAAVVCFASLARTPAEKARSLARLRALPEVELQNSMAAWRWAVQAELASAAGAWEEAETLWRRSAQLVPAVQTRVGLMDLLIARQRHEEALSLLSDTDTAPALALRRLQAQRALGANVDDVVARYDARFQQWMMDNDWKHAREMTMFYLDIKPDLARAHTLATANVSNQREPEDLALLSRVERELESRKAF